MDAPSAASRPVAVRLDDRQHSSLGVHARSSGRTLPQVVREAIDAYLGARLARPDLEREIEAATLRFAGTVDVLRGIAPISEAPPVRSARGRGYQVTLRVSGLAYAQLTGFASVDGDTVADQVRCAVDHHLAGGVTTRPVEQRPARAVQHEASHPRSALPGLPATEEVLRAPAPVLHSEVLQQLGREIVGGDHAPGQTLSLARLEQRFARSRTVIREAVRVLESLNLVVSRRRVGIVVQPTSQWSVLSPQVIEWRLASEGRDEQVRSLTQLRQAIEPLAARAAAQRRDTALAVQMLDIATHMRTLGRRGDGATTEYLEADVEFHTLLLRASGNEMFAALASTVAEVLRGRTRLGDAPARPTAHSLESHRQIARAIVRGRPDDAERLARAVVGDVLREIEHQRRPGATAT